VPVDDGALRGPIMLAEQHLVIRPMVDGVRLTSGMRFGGKPSAPGPERAIAAMRRHLDDLLPGSRGLPNVATWSGARPMTASGVPIIGPVVDRPNLIAATGHGTLGVTLAPVTAELIASYIATGAMRLEGVDPTLISAVTTARVRHYRRRNSIGCG
jgi:D-amino-acid dehydrogenase